MCKEICSICSKTALFRNKMSLTDTEILIVHTMVMRLSEKESLEYLKIKGHEIKLRTLQKAKKKIRDSTNQRKFELARNGLWEQHLERLDQLETILKLAWENYNLEKEPFKRVKILEIISSIQPLLSRYYSDSQAVVVNDAELKKLFN